MSRGACAGVRSFLTARDVLEIDAVNPARIPLATISLRLGCNKNRARELRALAARAPQVLDAHSPRKAVEMVSRGASA